MAAAIRVLIADDHPLFRDGVAQALGSDPAFALVGQAADAPGAVRLSRELAPDAALLDLGMPGGGLEAVREIRAASPGTRIVVLTVSEDERDLREALRAGAIAYVLKGIPAEELLDIVRGACSGQGYVAPALAARLLVEVGPEDPLAVLTERERAVLALIAAGHTNAEIGARLRLSYRSVRHSVTNILRKLGVHRRVEAALLSRRSGLTAGALADHHR